jgi:GntP family gluconate:H+ symporter
LSLGLFASHCFIPPTPGPLAALSILEADFGKVLFFGSIAALAATLAGYIFALYAGKNETLDEQEEPAVQEEKETVFKYHWSVAFLPIVLPLLLIGINSVAGCYKKSLSETAVSVAACAGNPVVALTLGAFIAVFLFGKCRKEELTVNGIMGKSILEAANILLITAAGGAFGEVLKKIDFASFFPDKMEHIGVFALLIPLFAAALVKIAQGSSTLAILTAAGITAPLLELLGLTTPVMRALTCCAVCCGAMMVSHTNDSYFWVVTRFSGMNVRQGLKLQTLGTLVSGLTAALVLLIMAFCCF